jgi:PKD repeat protein
MKERHMTITTGKFLAIFAWLGIGGMGLAAFGAEDYSLWKYACDITLNTTASGANVSAAQTGFPVLVRLTRATTAFSFSQAQRGGNDIRFAKADGATHLPYQIERWDSLGQVAEIWVKADVNGNDGKQSIVMFWGNPGAPDSSSGDRVFATTNNFLGVWHLNETGNTTVGGYANSTGATAYNDTGFNMDGAEVPAAIGRGQSFNGINQFIALPPGAVPPVKGTISLWVKWVGAYPAGRRLAFGTNQTVDAINCRHYMGIKDGTGCLYTQFQDLGAYVGPVAIETSNYHHIAVNWDSSATADFVDTYLDGVKVDHAAPGDFVSLTPNRARIGSWGGSEEGAEFWSGHIDEVRTENVTRSANWINLCYQSQKPDASWLSFSTRLTAPIINKQPSSQEKNVGQPTVFSVSASGNPAPAFQWRKSGAPIPGATDSLYKIDAVASVNAGVYDVVVSNSQGNATSDSVTLTVISPSKALFAVSDSVVKVPATVKYTDKSTGSFTKRIWDFGDNILDSTNVMNPQHEYTMPGLFNAKLVLMNGAVRQDSFSMTIRTFADNPITITGRHISPRLAEITFSNYGSIGESIIPPYADSVKLWYLSGAIPLTEEGAKEGGKYSLVTMKKSSPTYTAEVNVELNEADTVAGFMTQVHWNTGSWYWSRFNAGNGAIVLMKDTQIPVNTASITGRYVSGDSVVLAVHNMKSIDTSKVDSFAVWWSADTGDSIPSFSNPAGIRWFNLKDRYPVFDRTGGTDSFFVVSPLFNTGVEKKAFCAVVVKGKNDGASGWVKAGYLLGKNRPLNPIKLRAVLPTAGTITLRWDPVAGAGKIRIWYRTKSAVPVNIADFSSTQFVEIAVPVISDTEVVVTGLQPQTTYFFGGQVFAIGPGLWSNVTESSSVSATTASTTYGKLDSNSVKIASLVFDTSTNQIRVRWIVTKLTDNLEIGVSYSVASYPTVDIGDQQVIRVLAATGDTIVKLREPLLYDTTYYVSLWERTQEGKWTDPTVNSKAKVRTPYFNWQNVTYFRKIPGDTNFVFNNTILIITDSVKEITPTNGTVRFFPVGPEMLNGFIAAGLPFYFSLKEESHKFKVSMKTTIPPGRQVSDIRIYQYKNGLWNVDRTTKPDNNGYVSIYTNDLEFPFMALIDTQRVSLVRGGHTDTLDAGVDATDMLYISDNCGNASWQYSYAKGGDAFSPNYTQKGVLDGKNAVVPILIRGINVSIDNGLRAFIEVSDGVHTDMFNVSRQVIRTDKSDYVSTETNKWAPLRVTADLADSDIRTVLKDGSSDPTWSYDAKKMRLFRWLPNDSNQAHLSKWVEYSDDRAELFSPKPGMLIWLKTKESRPVNFGRGITPSLKVSHDVPLAAKSWTDFALPYKFDIKIGDILDSTGPGADSLQFYLWEQDSVSKGYVSKTAFIKAFSGSGLDNLNWKLSSKDLTGFTVYNPKNAPVMLRIPPIPETMSKYELTKKASDNGWTVSLNAKTADGSLLGPVYCGYSGITGLSMQYFPMAPSFSDVCVGVYDNRDKRL